MAHFPYMTNAPSDPITLIQSKNKSELIGAKPFMQLSEFISGNIKTIGYDKISSFRINNFTGDRMPPILTGMEVGVSGNLGAIRKAKCTIKFSSIDQLQIYKGFLQPGGAKLLTWGWVYDNISVTLPTHSIRLANDIIANIDNWKQMCANAGYRADGICGPLTNFNITYNNDLTVDVEIEIGSISEIPGWLSLHKKNKTSSIDSKDQTTNPLIQVVDALNLDAEFDGLTEDTIMNYTVNDTWHDRSLSFYTTGDCFVQLGFALKQIVNKFGSSGTNSANVGYDMFFDNSIATCHRNMISCSENVVFPNQFTIGFTEYAGADNSIAVKPAIDFVSGLATITKELGPFRFPNGREDHFPELPNQAITVDMGNEKVILSTGFYNNKTNYNTGAIGKIENIYVRTRFLKECVTGADTVYDFFDKLLPEINKAGGGLYNLDLRDGTQKGGIIALTIIDINLSHTAPTSIPTLNIFGTQTSITNIELDCSLPKQIIGQIVASKGGHYSQKLGKRLFGTIDNDPIMKNLNKNKETIRNNGAVTYRWYTRAWNGLVSFFTDMFGIPVGNNRIFFKSDKMGLSAGELMCGIVRDESIVKSIYFGSDRSQLKNALIPIRITITTLGVSGIGIGNVIDLTPSPAPWLSKSDGYWQVTNVEHKVDNSKWETVIELRFRIAN